MDGLSYFFAEFAERQPWRSLASCHGADPALFHPKNPDRMGDAASYCGICPVRLHCLDFALVQERQDGIYGGFTERERTVAKKTRTVHLLRARAGG